MQAFAFNQLAEGYLRLPMRWHGEVFIDRLKGVCSMTESARCQQVSRKDDKTNQHTAPATDVPTGLPNGSREVCKKWRLAACHARLYGSIGLTVADHATIHPAATEHKYRMPRTAS